MSIISKIEKTYGSFFFKNQLNDLSKIKNHFDYHSFEFSKTLGIKKKFFLNKRILETGSGPGTHTYILDKLVGKKGDLHSFDLSKKNVKKIKARNYVSNFVCTSGDVAKLGKILNNFNYCEKNKYDLVFAHNWLHHCAEPTKAIFDIGRTLKKGGLFYICIYQSRTFRHFIVSLVRKFRSKIDSKYILNNAPYFFPIGFSKFRNYQNIFFENIIDDFMPPFVRFTHSEKLIKTMNILGYKIIKTGYRNILKKKTLYEYDDFQLKLGFKKIKNVKLTKIQLKLLEKNLFESQPMHMIKASNNKDNLSKIYNDYLNLFKNMNKKKINKTLLALYRIRAEYANSTKNIPEKIFDLKKLYEFLRFNNYNIYSINNENDKSIFWKNKQHPFYDIYNKFKN
jgi:SAM-dependent methyltransferase